MSYIIHTYLFNCKNYDFLHEKDKYIYTCRVRLGYAHVANNRYEKWLMYAIGGSANPTIFSEGNYFLASKSTQVSLQVCDILSFLVYSERTNMYINQY